MSQFRVSNVDKRNFISTFAFCVVPGHIGNHVIILIEDEYQSLIGVPIGSKQKSIKYEPV